MVNDNPEAREANQRLWEISKINMELQRMEHEKWLKEHGRLPPDYDIPPRESDKIPREGLFTRLFNLVDMYMTLAWGWFMLAVVGLFGVFFVWALIEKIFFGG